MLELQLLAQVQVLELAEMDSFVGLVAFATYP